MVILYSFLSFLCLSPRCLRIVRLLVAGIIVGTITVPNVTAADVEAGAKIFKTSCTACHSIGDGKLVGPDLKDVHKRVPSEEWMIPWIRNSSEVVASGDPYGNKILKEFNGIPMTANPFSDEEILSVIAYIKEESAKAPEVVEGPVDNPYEKRNDHQVEDSGISGPVTIVIVLLVLLVVMASVRIALKKINAELHEDDEPNGKSVIDGFFNWLAGHKRWVALFILISIGILARAAWFGLLYVNVTQGYEPEQPIWFSHQIHAGKNGINCVYCHSGAEKSRTAGIPSANVCMNCHKAIKKGTFSGENEIPKIYAALDYDVEKDEYGDNPKPIKWVKVHNLPDLSYFNHSQHVVVGEIACQRCHGPVEEMHVMRQESMLTMGWCIDCHRNTEVKMDGNDYYTELQANLMAKYPGEKITVDKMGGIDCARCHY